VQAAIEEIFDAVRAATGDRPIAVVIDGLDRVSGDPRAHLQRLLAASRLVTDLSAAVIATFAAPFAAVGSPAGWSQHVVLGFDADERGALELALLKRIDAAGVELADPVPITQRIAAEALGQPRHAMALLRAAALHALAGGRAGLSVDDVEAVAADVRAAMALPPHPAHDPDADELPPRDVDDGGAGQAT
jgi:hypothetical protein